LEKNICLAIILLSYDSHRQSGSSSKLTPYRGTRQELTRSLPFTRERNAEEKTCLIWVWMIAIGSWKMDHDLGQGSLSLTQHFFDRFEEAALWNAVETAMRQFFWYEPLVEGWKRSWREALDDYRSFGQPVRPHSVELWGPSNVGYPMTNSAMSNQSTRESTPSSTASRDILPDRTRQISLAMESNISQDASTAHPPAVTLPPMLSLDIFLGQIE